MNGRDMKGLMWFAFRHPFATSLLAALAIFGTSTRLGYSTRVAVVEGLLLMIFVLILWWPRRGYLSRRVLSWLDDDDPRVAKPGPP